MGQAKRRGTPEERRELAIAWEEAYREDRERFPLFRQARRPDKGGAWLALAAALALTTPSR